MASHELATFLMHNFQENLPLQAKTDLTLRSQPLISIITVNYNGLDLTVELLNSIKQLSYKNVEIFVVDNASKDNAQSFFNNDYPEVKFIRSEKNLGFAGGRAGLAHRRRHPLRAFAAVRLSVPAAWP